jgi:diguanylate cyclase
VGDEVLRGVAKALRRKTRDMDLAARYGGEEFAVIMPGTPLIEACGAAARLRAAVEKFVFQPQQQNLRVTASFGVAQIYAGETAAALIRRADLALYAAKREGRNCVFWQDGEAIGRWHAPQPLAPQDDPSSASAVRRLPGDRPDLSSSDRDAAAAMPPLDWRTTYGPASCTTFCQHVRTRIGEWTRDGALFSLVLVEPDQCRPGLEGSTRQGREQVIHAIATFLTATVRDMDLVGQYGPSCFAVLLPTASLSVAIQVTERLREGFALCTPQASDDRSPATLSMGLVQVAEGDDTFSLFQRAEAALDAAQRHGGNCGYYEAQGQCSPIAAVLAAEADRPDAGAAECAARSPGVPR